MGAGQQISVDEADIGLSELLDRAERGEEITISRAGRPVARVTPTPPPHVVEAARKAIEELVALREKLSQSGVRPITLEEILEARHAGHKY